MIRAQLSKQLRDAEGKMYLQVDLAIEKGERVALFGPSGAGKTSTLRMLAGLMEPDAGFIEAHGVCWYDSKTKVRLKPGKRNIGFVFQDFALFPNMTVLENLRFAQGGTKNGPSISELLEVMELGALQHRLPGVLSGGQQQRVAVARALVTEPDMLMLDEPLSALDNDTRSRLQDYLRQVQGQFGTTLLFISHEIGELYQLAQRVLVMERGLIIKEGTPEQVFLGAMPHDTQDEFTVTGVLLKKEFNMEGNFTITIASQSRLQTFVVHQEWVAEIEVGDQIQFSAVLSDPKIMKIS